MSPISKLSMDDLKGVQTGESEVKNPDWIEVKAAIMALNGENKTMVSLEQTKDFYMIIAGSQAALIAYVSLDNTEYHYVMGSGAPGTMIRINAGGQSGEFSAHICASVSDALKAAKQFYKDQTLSRDVRWTKDA